jgi:hypothetical protein
MCSNIAMHRPQSAVNAFASSAPAAYTDLRGHELTHDPTGNRRQFISLLVGGRLSLNGIFDTLLVLAREYFFSIGVYWWCFAGVVSHHCHPLSYDTSPILNSPPV